MTRIKAFESLKNDAYFGRVYKLLNPSDIEDCRSFIMKHENMDKNSFAELTNRWRLDEIKEKKEKKKQAIKWELVSVANSKT